MTSSLRAGGRYAPSLPKGLTQSAGCALPTRGWGGVAGAQAQGPWRGGGVSSPPRARPAGAGLSPRGRGLRPECGRGAARRAVPGGQLSESRGSGKRGEAERPRCAKPAGSASEPGRAAVWPGREVSQEAGLVRRKEGDKFPKHTCVRARGFWSTTERKRKSLQAAVR